VRLYAHALPLLFNMPATTLTNQQIDIALLLKSQGAELADRIFESGSFEQRVNIVTGFFESFIYKRSARFARLEKLIFSLYQSAGFPSINELVNQSNLSQRQFERHFRDLTGFPAKTFLKIARFEKLVRTISCSKANSPQTLTAIALELGYYDQAHLNRQFKEFTGMSPSHYFRLQDVQDRL
jgi:AraC-like DNA-binding protein